MKPRCSCKFKENGLLQCSLITDDDRKKIFEEFWSLDWQAKKVYVRFLTKKTKTVRARNRKECDKSKRKFSSVYYLKKGNATVRVLFLDTLAIGSWTAQNWHQEPTGDTDTDEVNNPEDGTGGFRKQSR